MVLDGELTSGQLASFVLYTITLSVGLLGVGGIFNNIITALSVAEKVIKTKILKVLHIFFFKIFKNKIH